MPHRRTDVPDTPPWEQWITFELVDPDRNRYRQYRLDLTTDLFGNCVLIRSWGRIGRPTRSQICAGQSRSEIVALGEQIARRRLLHGYRVTAKG